MEKNVINKLAVHAGDWNENVKREFNEDRKDLKRYGGDFLWGVGEKGTNLICLNVPFSYLQIENMGDAKKVYACVGGRLRKVSLEKAKSIAVGLYCSRKQRA